MINDVLTGAPYYTSKNINHYILAEEGTEAGNLYNLGTINQIHSVIAN